MLGTEPKTQSTNGAPQIAPHRALVRSFGEVAAALGELKDLIPLLRMIAARICDLTGVPRCSVYLRDETTGLFRGQVGHADRDIDALVRRLVAASEADHFTQEILETKRPVIVANAQDDPRPIRATMRAWKVRSMLGVPMMLRGEVIGLVFLDAEDQAWTFTDNVIEVASTFADLAAAAIAQAQLTIDLRHSLDTVAKQNKLLRRSTAVDERLGALSVEAGGFGEIADAVAELTGKPCAIYDHEHRMLAKANPDWLDESEAPQMPDGSVWSMPEVADAVAALSKSRSRVLLPLPAARLHRRLLIAPVSVRDSEWGTLVVMEYGTRFTPLDLHIARRAAMSVSLEMSAERRAARGEWDARASLLGELIRGNRDSDSLERRAHYLGVELFASRVLCLITSADSRDGQLPTAAEVSAALTSATGGQVLATGVAEGVLFALDLDCDLPSREAIKQMRGHVEQTLQSLEARGGRLIAALSACCSGAPAYTRAYAETRQVLNCLTKIADPTDSSVLTADDLGPGRLLLASTNREEALRFSRDALGPILSNERGMLDLLDTLFVFFDCSRSVRRSAQVLSMHENTIRYRLARVEELTGLAVSESCDDQLTIQLALLILRISGEKPLGRETQNSEEPELVPAD
jgi:sugar diacid utilization regulator/GAF domain-containing protein